MTDVSVVIPTYNRARCVERALDSVLSQSGVTIEVIVVDDGSTDETTQVLEGYQDRIKVLSQDNSGPSGARNRGVAAAQGEHLVFLDSDDELVPGILKEAVAALQAHPEYDAVYGRAVNVDASGQLRSAWECAERSGDLFPDIVIGHTLAMGSFMIRNADLPQPVFDETKRFGEDMKFLLRYAKDHLFWYVPRLFLKRHVHGAMATMTGGEDDVLARRTRLLDELFGGEAEAIKRAYLTPRVVADWYRTDAFYKAEASKLVLARELMHKSIRYWPFQLKPYLWFLAHRVPTKWKRRLRAT